MIVPKIGLWIILYTEYSPKQKTWCTRYISKLIVEMNVIIELLLVLLNNFFKIAKTTVELIKQ